MPRCTGRFTTIAGPDQLSPRDQAALVAQLQVGLREDGQHEAARNGIVMLLNKLHDREDVTYRTRTDVEAILASIDDQSPRQHISTSTSSPTDPQPATKPETIDRAYPPTQVRTAKPAPPAQPAPPTPTNAGGISRRTTIALIGGAAALVVVAVIGISVLDKHGQGESAPTSAAPPTSSPRSYGTQEVLPFTTLNKPQGVAVDTAGTLYVADGSNGRVVKLAAGSASQEVLPFTGLSHPYGVAVDAAGNLYVADSKNNRVLKLPVQ